MLCLYQNATNVISLFEWVLFRDINTEKDRLYNDIISCLEKENVMFMSHQMDLGKSIVKDLCDVLWYVDPFHERLKSRHITIPKPFDRFTGYRNWKQQHKREPQVKVIIQLFCN